MNYIPGTIVGLFGIAYLIWGALEKESLLRRNRLIQGMINVGIAVVLYVLFTVLRK